MMKDSLILLSAEEQKARINKVTVAMLAQGIEYALITSNANLYYFTGRVFSGYVLLSQHYAPVYFVKRPVHLTDPRAISIHKPENIVEALASLGLTIGDAVAFELNLLPYNKVIRLSKALGCRHIEDISAAISLARSVKTPQEIAMIRESGVKQAYVYNQVPRLYKPGMSDIELQIEIERLSRLEGCLGQFRISGEEMELYMGNVLVGDNADAPAPFDFAMGGAGADPSLPIGANGSVIKPHTSVMVDMNGNFTGYMSDMTRCFKLGDIATLAMDAHRLSIDICHCLAEMGRPGASAREMYETALDMVRKAGLEDYFMGHRQHAGFVGHGIGIEVNESPVIAPRSRDILQEGNVIAIEPKFVIPGTGAVGIENTYAVTPEGPMECLTVGPEEIKDLD